MKRKGFTLIELIAVLVILAIIALIVTPLVLNIIRKARVAADKRSIDAYGRSIEIAVANYLLDNGKFPSSVRKLTIEYSGNIVECETTQLNSDSSVYLKDCKVSGREVDYTYGRYEEKFAKLIDDADNDNEVSVGDKYSYKVNDENIFYFYVLSIENDRVNLIMDRNICDNGELTEEGKKCPYYWSNGNPNKNGPNSSMLSLYAGTREWKNVPNMNLDYLDEGRLEDSSSGYIGINIVNGIGSITRYDGTIQELNTSDDSPIKARLPKYSELVSEEAGCKMYNEAGAYGTCKKWLVEYLYESSNNTAKEAYISNPKISSIVGYWILSSDTKIRNDVARFVDGDGLVSIANPSYPSNGVRPVITVLKSTLE